MPKHTLSMLLVIGLSTIVYAGDNSQATLGDVKEAVYKLIIQNKANIDKSNLLDEKVQKIEKASIENDTRVSKRDAIDLLIGDFVAKNEYMLPKNKSIRE